MKTSTLSLLGFLAVASAPVLAESGAFKAQVIGSQSQINVKSLQADGLGGSISRDLSKDDQNDELNAVGGGAAFEWNLGEPLRLGAGLGYIQYEGDHEKAGYSDMIGNVYASMDFIDQEMFDLYGLVGLSYHNLSLDDFRSNGIAVSADPTGLINGDLGIGARFKLNYNTTFGMEYKYTNTFARNDVDLKLKGAGLSYDGLKYKDVGIENNELVASLGFAF